MDVHRRERRVAAKRLRFLDDQALDALQATETALNVARSERKRREHDLRADAQRALKERRRGAIREAVEDRRLRLFDPFIQQQQERLSRDTQSHRRTTRSSHKHAPAPLRLRPTGAVH